MIHRLQKCECMKSMLYSTIRKNNYNRHHYHDWSKYSNNTRIQGIIPSIIDSLTSKVIGLNKSPTLSIVYDQNVLSSSLHHFHDHFYDPNFVEIANRIGVSVIRKELNGGNLNSIVDCIQQLNLDDSIDGISIENIVQNQKLDIFKFYSYVSMEKDVDGRHPTHFSFIRSAREFVYRSDRFRYHDFQYSIPCKAQAVLELMNRLFVDMEGKNALIFGSKSRFDIEISLLFSKLHSTVTVSNEFTSETSLANLIKKSDIIICSNVEGIYNARKFLKIIKSDTIVIDVSNCCSKETQEIYQYYRPINIIQCPPVIKSLMLLKNTISTVSRRRTNEKKE